MYAITSFKQRALLCLVILFSTAMCQKDDAAGGGNGAEYTSLIGYWKLKNGVSYAKKADGTTITTATLKEGVFAHEFFKDGKYTGHDLTGTLPSATGTWKLEVKKTDGKDIEEGILAVSTADTKDMAGELFVDADGAIRYEIATIDAPVGGSKSVMTLTTKKYKGYPYDENWVVYTYQKQ